MIKKKNYHLIVCVLLLIPIAFSYGLSPNYSEIFNFTIESIDLKNILRAIMGLYFAMITLWIIGIINPTLWKTATITAVLFMTGLGFGRLLSLLLDGIPSLSFLLGTFAELLLAFWGFLNLKRERLV